MAGLIMSSRTENYIIRFIALLFLIYVCFRLVPPVILQGHLSLFLSSFNIQNSTNRTTNIITDNIPPLPQVSSSSSSAPLLQSSFNSIPLPLHKVSVCCLILLHLFPFSKKIYLLYIFCKLLYYYLRVKIDRVCDLFSRRILVWKKKRLVYKASTTQIPLQSSQAPWLKLIQSLRKK